MGDKMSAARRKGKWIGGHPVLGYDIDTKGGRIIVTPTEAEQARTSFGLYLAYGSLLPVLRECPQRGLVTKRWTHMVLVGKTARFGVTCNTR